MLNKLVINYSTGLEIDSKSKNPFVVVKAENKVSGRYLIGRA